MLPWSLSSNNSQINNPLIVLTAVSSHISVYSFIYIFFNKTTAKIPEKCMIMLLKTAITSKVLDEWNILFNFQISFPDFCFIKKIYFEI